MKTKMYGKILIGGTVVGLIWKNWSTIEKLLDSILVSYRSNQLILPPSQLELPPTKLLQPGDETFQMIWDRLKNSKLEEVPTAPLGNSSAFGVMESPPPADPALVDKVRNANAVLVGGRRGSGKTATIMGLQESLRHVASPYAIGLPAKVAKLLPPWYGLADDPADVPPNSTIYFPESYRFFHSRSTQSQMGRMLSDLINLSRHRGQILFFDVQNTAQLDRIIVSEADLIIMKEPGPFHRGFERPQLRPVMEAARAAFAGIGPHRKKKANLVSDGDSMQIMENSLPSFWSERLSRMFADAGPVSFSNSKTRTSFSGLVKNAR